MKQRQSDSREWIKVLHVVPWFTVRAGGAVVVVADAAEALTEVGVKSQVVATNLSDPWSLRGARPVSREELPGNHECLDVRLFDSRQPRRFAYSPALAQYVSENAGQFDVIHIHSLWLYPQLAAYRTATRLGVPYIVSPHGALDPFLRRHGRFRKACMSALWQNRMLSRADVVHLTTDDEDRLISDVVENTSRVVAPIGVDTEAFRRPGDSARFRDRFLGGDRSQLVLFLGRITRKKGLDVLIRAVAEPDVSETGAHLAIVGPDDEGLGSGLQALASRLGVADRVTFTGPLYGEGRRDALAAATVWALPSHSENFGIAVVEALASGLPTVISPQVNIADEISSAGAARVARPVPAEFSAAIGGLLVDATARAELSECARRFSRRFDWENVAPGLRDMYDLAIARRRQSDPSQSEH